jgi:hypothetical protein
VPIGGFYIFNAADFRYAKATLPDIPLFTMATYMDHLAEDVLPGLINKLAAEKA